MKRLMIFRGLPGSGKSTAAKSLVSNTVYRASKDDIRTMFGVKSSDNESLVHSVFIDSIRKMLVSGIDVVADCTHILERDLDVYRALAHQIGDIELTTKIFKVGPTECIKRDKLRTGLASVGEDVIMRMWKKSRWQVGWPDDIIEIYPARYERKASLQDKSLQDAVIVDLDGTAMIIGDRSPYDASRCDETDTPCPAIQKTLSALVKDGVKLIFMSGRSDADRAATLRSLEMHYRFSDEEFILHMRKDGDTRKDEFVKADLYADNVYAKYNIICVFDDRVSVVRFWRSIGLTVFQLDDREF